MNTVVPKNLLKVGLTGGIASGKTLVGSFLKKHGLPVIDLDVLGKKLTDENPKLVTEIQKLCAQKVSFGGTLDREALSQVFFSDPQVRSKVESLLHPLIIRQFEKKCARIASQGGKLVICEAALLIEHGYFKKLDELIVVIASREARIQRLMKRNNTSEAMAEQILATQTNDNEREKCATHILSNEGTIEELEKMVEELIRKLLPST